MKPIALLFFFVASQTSIAQVIFESSYVSEGQSFTITLPEGNKHIGLIEEGTHLYSKDPNMKVDQMENPKSNGYAIGMVENFEGLTHEDLIENPFLFETEDINNKLEFTSKTGHKFLLAEGNVAMDGEEKMHIILGTGVFDEVLVLVLYFDVEEIMLTNPFMEMSSLLETYKILETDRENEFITGLYEEEQEYSEMTTFFNEGFETSLSFEGIYFEEEYNEETAWTTDFDQDYPELLTAYSYQTFALDEYEEEVVISQGGVKIFSGGDHLNYQNFESKLAAVQKVFTDYEITGIENSEQISGTDYTFEKYTLTSASGDLLDLYSVVYYDEMMFILVYGTENLTDEFQLSYEPFILGLNP